MPRLNNSKKISAVSVTMTSIYLQDNLSIKMLSSFCTRIQNENNR